MPASARVVKALGVCISLAVSTAAALGKGPQVATDMGMIEGKKEGRVNTFLGIPYAAPPVGDRRWRPPTPPQKWTGVRKATSFGPRCMQAREYDDMVFRDPGPSEDCLTLNVWTPADSRQSLPVMVWIYGGGFKAGSTSEPRQDGTNLAKHGVVVVSMNYRLGVFGFFTHPELVTKSGNGAAGNYGFLDQVAALAWVQRNIAALGGDPRNVTIFGESAGSFSVSALMASPLAAGLFHKAIGESGAAFFSRGMPFKGLAERQQTDTQFAEAELGMKSLKELRAVAASKLLKAATKKQGSKNKYKFSPTVDNYFLPESVPRIFAQGKQNDVPLLAGWNQDEGDAELNGNANPTAAIRATAEKEFGPRATEFLQLYPARTDGEAKRSLQDYNGDDFIAWSTWKWLEEQRATGKQVVYRYRFDLSLPARDNPEGLGAYHSAEIEYVFGQLGSKKLPWRVEDRALSEQIQKYWTNFARTGNPNGPGLPPWPAYGPHDGWQTMHLNAQSQAQRDDLRARYEFLDRVWAK